MASWRARHSQLADQMTESDEYNDCFPLTQPSGAAEEDVAATEPRAGRPFRVCLTGGPCAGKSSALSILRTRLQKCGFQVLAVPEVATPLFEGSGGYDPAWVGGPQHIDLQHIFITHQIAQEESFLGLAKLREAPAVVLCDRGCLDGFTFCSAAEWSEVLAKAGVTQEELFARYDLVVHLKTAAGFEGDRFYQFGPGSNNPSRFHTPSQALECDLKSAQVYGAHPAFVVVENRPTFEEKIGAVLAAVQSRLKLSMGLCNKRARRPVQAVKLPDSLPADAAARLEIYETTITTVELESGRHQLRRHRRLDGGEEVAAASGGGGEGGSIGAATEGSFGLGRRMSCSGAGRLSTACRSSSPLSAVAMCAFTALPVPAVFVCHSRGASRESSALYLSVLRL